MLSGPEILEIHPETNMKTLLLLPLLLVSCNGYANSDLSKNHLLDNPICQQQAFNNNDMNSNIAMSRSGQLVYALPAQNRDSYSTLTTQGGYSVAPGNTAAAAATTANSNVGTTGASNSNAQNMHTSSSSISTSYGVPAVAASSNSLGGYASSAGTHSPTTYYYYHYPGGQVAAGTSNHGWGETTGYGEEEDSGILGGLGGLAGLIGLKGLKGLGGLGLFALLKLFKPLLLPLLFLPLLLLSPLLLLFIPIPVITIPTNQGRSTGYQTVGEVMSEKVYDGVQVAQQVLSSTQCVERLACELNKRSQGTLIDSIVKGLFDKTRPYLSKTFRRAVRVYMESSSVPNNDAKCSKFVCEYHKFSSFESGTPDYKPASVQYDFVSSKGNEIKQN